MSLCNSLLKVGLDNYRALDRAPSAGLIVSSQATRFVADSVQMSRMLYIAISAPNPPWGGPPPPRALLFPY